LTAIVKHGQNVEKEELDGWRWGLSMWFRALLVGTCVAGLLTACAVVDPVDNRYDTISRSLAKARNESIFLNLVRASHDYPLSFVTIANVTPSLTNTSSLGLPSFLLGPRFANSLPTSSPQRDVVFGNTTASDTTAVSTNFNVSTQETSTFYEGFLKPIDLTTLDYFIRQGYPRELLFWLFTDSFELTLGPHKVGYHYNPPDDYGCSPLDPRHRCFVDWVHAATLTGLTVEELTEEKSSGGAGAAKGGAEASGSAAGKPATTVFSRFCFNSVLAQEARALVTSDEAMRVKADLDVKNDAQLYQSDLTCGSPAWQPAKTAGTPQPDILPLTFSNGELKFTIVPRSAYGVFEFLGTLMKIQREKLSPAADAFIPANRQYAAAPPNLVTVHEDPQLLQVTRNLGGDCFVHTWFNDGDYCVPEDAATTKRVFGLLAQLIAIQTAATDLSITPIVRVLQ
jgi:hypothetical protein